MLLTIWLNLPHWAFNFWLTDFFWNLRFTEYSHILAVNASTAWARVSAAHAAPSPPRGETRLNAQSVAEPEGWSAAGGGELRRLLPLNRWLINTSHANRVGWGEGACRGWVVSVLSGCCCCCCLQVILIWFPARGATTLPTRSRHLQPCRHEFEMRERGREGGGGGWGVREKEEWWR